MPDTHDVLAVADRLWRGEVSTTEIHPLRPTTGLAEVADGVAFVPSFANVSAVSTEDGLLLVDTGSAFMAGEIHRTLRAWSPGRLHTAVYSHGHIDHVFGVPVWAAESAEAGWPEPVVVAHEALPARFDRYIMTAGYNGIINRRQFNIDSLEWPTEYRYPDRTYRDHLELEVGGTRAELHHAEGETDDHTWTWLPDARVLCCGDLFIWASPNAGNPQKVQRYPLEWADALRRMLALYDSPGGGPEVLLPGHGYPVVGADRVRQALRRHRRAARVAGGADARPHERRGPARRGDPHRRPPGPPDGAALPPTRLRRARVHRPHRVAPLRRVVGRQPGHPEAGPGAGARPRAGRSGRWGRRRWPTGPWPWWAGDERPTAEPATPTTPPCGWPGTWPSWPGWPPRTTPACSAVRRTVFTRRADAASSTMAHGVFSWAARESGDGGGDRATLTRPDRPSWPPL